MWLGTLDDMTDTIHIDFVGKKVELISPTGERRPMPADLELVGVASPPGRSDDD